MAQCNVFKCLFCPTNSPKPKDLQFTNMYDKEKQIHISQHLRGWNKQMFYKTEMTKTIIQLLK